MIEFVYVHERERNRQRVALNIARIDTNPQTIFVASEYVKGSIKYTIWTSCHDSIADQVLSVHVADPDSILAMKTIS